MSLKTDLPGYRQAVVEGGSAPISRAYYVYLQNIATTVDGLSAASGNVTIPELPISENANVVGASGFSIYAQGTLKTGIVRVLLMGDTQNPGNTQYYGSGPTGERGWFSVSDALAASSNVTLTVGTDGVTTFDLADLADSGTGSALVKITRDSKGRLAGTSAATTTDLTEGTNLYFTNARADARIDAQKGVALGLAPLGSDSKLSTDYLPAAVLGQVEYQGGWDASAGTPPSSTPEKGWYYIVTVAGSTDLDGITDWAVGDWAIYDGTAWSKVDNTDAVVMVNGQTGNVTLTAADVGAATAAQGALADTALQPGANLSTLTNDVGFLTDAPSDGSQYVRKDGAWVVVTGGGGSGDVVGPAASTDGNVALFDGATGKLLKDGGSFGANVRAAVLTGLSAATSAAIAATDTVLQAFGKLQAQTTDNLLPKGYIDGLQMKWVSGTALTVTSGAAYIEGSSKVLSATADIAKTGLSLTASTWYHVYLYDNAGTPDVEIVTTAPASPYNGTARSKTGDTGRRYIGSVRTDSTGALFKFYVSLGEVFYLEKVGVRQFLVAGTAAAPTAVSFATLAPVSATFITVSQLNSSATTAVIDSSDMNYSPGSARWMEATGNSNFTFSIPLPASRNLSYYYVSAPSSGSLYLTMISYRYER